MNWLRRMLGGRPMTLVGHAFVDVVVNEDVFYWRDCYGRCWMANSRWGWFRVRAKAID